MSVDVLQLPLGPIGTNCYLVRRRESREAVVVDPSADASAIRLELASMGASCAGILVTHGHWDHLGAVADLAEASEAPVHMAEDERSLLENINDYTPPGVVFRSYTPDVLLAGDESLELAGLAFAVTRVPGHSPGHLAFHTGDALFSGDVLFSGSVGRTDLPGSNWETLLGSIGTLVERYPPETVVYPGHGPATTLGRELASNPFLAELRSARQ
jgi:glyoxylase-like metal-dependent hydrolase (beta-lactamase superfamily II)